MDSSLPRPALPSHRRCLRYRCSSGREKAHSAQPNHTQPSPAAAIAAVAEVEQQTAVSCSQTRLQPTQGGGRGGFGPTFIAIEPAVHPTYVHAHPPVPLVLDKNMIENSIAKARELHDRLTVRFQYVAQLLKNWPDHMQNCSGEIFCCLETPGRKK